MRRIKFFVLLTLLSDVVCAQQPASPVPDTTVFMLQPATFQLESGRPFFMWSERPAAIAFIMYNRWGQVVAKSENPDFKIDDALVNKNAPLGIGDTFIYVVRVSFNGKAEQVYRADVVYTGKYCSG